MYKNVNGDGRRRGCVRMSKKVQSSEAFDHLAWYEDTESHVLPAYLLACVMGNWMPPTAVHIIMGQNQL